MLRQARPGTYNRSRPRDPDPGFGYYDELPPRLGLAASWDMAFKDKAESDYVVGLVAGRRGADVYLIDRVKGQWSFSESCRQVEQLDRGYPGTHTILIEDAANGPAIIDALKHKIAGIIAVPPEGGKLARAQAAQPKVEAGNVYLPNPRPHGQSMPERGWVDDFLYQLTVFVSEANNKAHSFEGVRKETAATDATGLGCQI